MQCHHFFSELQTLPATTAAGVEETNQQTKSAPTSFVGIVELDELRGLQKVGQVFEAIISKFVTEPETRFRISLEVHAERSDGFSEDVESIVRDNADTLGFSQKRFD